MSANALTAAMDDGRLIRLRTELASVRTSATSAVTSHIIEMAKTLQLRTIAEGVERQEQLDYLRAHGVDLAQGWLFSRALPAAGFIAYRNALRRAG